MTLSFSSGLIPQSLFRVFRPEVAGQTIPRSMSRAASRGFLRGGLLFSKFTSLIAGGLILLAACDRSVVSEPGPAPSSEEPSRFLQGEIDTIVRLAAGKATRFLYAPTRGATYSISTTGPFPVRLVFRDSADRDTLAANLCPVYASSALGHVWRSMDGKAITIRVAGSDSTRDGAVILSVKTLAAAEDSEPDNKPNQARWLIPDHSIHETVLAPNDTDWFKIPVQKGRIYRMLHVSKEGAMPALLDRDSKAIPLTGYQDTLAIWRSNFDGVVYASIANGTYSKFGKCRISVWTDSVEYDAYEPDDIRANATLLSVGGASQHHFLQPWDQDWFKFSVDSGKRYSISMNNSPNGAHTVFWGSKFFIFSDSSNSTPIDSLGKTFDFRAVHSGTYFVEYSLPDWYYTGSYDISVRLDSIQDRFEADDLRFQAAWITTDSTPQRHILSLGDHDWIKFRVDSGMSYEVRTTYDSTNLIRFVIFSDSSRTSGDTASGYYGRSIKTYHDGVVYVDIYDELASITGPYKVAVSIDTADVDAYEPDDNSSQASWITTDSVAQRHKIQYGEVDWFRFSVDSGSVYRVRAGDFRPGAYAIYNGNFCMHYDSLETGCRLPDYVNGVFQARKTGTIFLEYRCGGDRDVPDNQYTIAVWRDTTSLDKYEPDDDSRQARWIGTDSVLQTHFMWPNEQDCIKFKADSGVVYRIQGFGDWDRRGVGYGLRFDIQSDSVFPGIIQSFHGDATLKARKSGVVSVDVRGSDSYTEGVYRLAVSPIPCGDDPFEPDLLPQQAAPLLPDSVPQRRYLQATDEDWCKVELVAGKRYRIELSSESNPFQLVKAELIRQWSPWQAVDANVTDRRGLEYTAPASGTYYLRIIGVDGEASGWYTIGLVSL